MLSLRLADRGLGRSQGVGQLSVAADGYAASLAFSPDGRRLAAGTNDGVLLLHAQDGERRGPPIEVGKAEINPVSFSPDGRLLAASAADQTSTVWDLASRTRLGTTFPTVQGAVPVADFAPDGDLVIAYLADAVKWPMDPRTRQRVACKVAGATSPPRRGTTFCPAGTASTSARLSLNPRGVAPRLSGLREE